MIHSPKLRGKQDGVASNQRTIHLGMSFILEYVIIAPRLALRYWVPSMHRAHTLKSAISMEKKGSEGCLAWD